MTLIFNSKFVLYLWRLQRVETQSQNLLSFIEAEVEPPEELVFNNFLSQEISNVLDTLTDRESYVIRLRYGLDDGRMRSLSEIGLQLNLSRERVRQIEAKALRGLRHLSRNRVLKEYLRASVMGGDRISLGFVGGDRCSPLSGIFNGSDRTQAP